MLLAYKKKANIAAAFWFVSMVLFVIFAVTTENRLSDIGETLKMLLLTLNVLTFWFAFWAYAKAKGYSGLVGVVLPIFSIVGLIILHSLRDKHPEEFQPNEGDHQ